jgi:hypothetical protein
MRRPTNIFRSAIFTFITLWFFSFPPDTFSSSSLNMNSIMTLRLGDSAQHLLDILGRPSQKQSLGGKGEEAWFYDQVRINLDRKQGIHSLIVTFKKALDPKDILPTNLAVHEYQPYQSAHEGPLQRQWIDPEKNHFWVLSLHDKKVTHFFIRALPQDIQNHPSPKRPWHEWLENQHQNGEKNIFVPTEEESIINP